MKKITVTGENFEKCLGKMVKRFESYYMMKFEKIYFAGEKESVKLPIFYGIGWKNDKLVKSLHVISSYIHVAKHYFREEWEKNTDSFDAKMYETQKCLIHMEDSAYSAYVLCEGDQVRFLPFGITVVYLNNKIFSNRKMIFVPYPLKGFIKAKDKEKELQEREELRKKEEDAYLKELENDPY
nr:MAG TPA: hypothetical protein [Caudoviricetes sp.]